MLADHIIRPQKAVIFLSETPRPEITYAFMREWTVAGPLSGDETWLAAMFRGESVDEINDKVYGGEFAGDLGGAIPHYVFTPQGHAVDIIGMMWMVGREQPIVPHPNRLFLYQFFKTNNFCSASDIIYKDKDADVPRWRIMSLSQSCEIL